MLVLDELELVLVVVVEVDEELVVVVLIEDELELELVVVIEVDVMGTYTHFAPVYIYKRPADVSKYVRPVYTSSPVGADVLVSTCVDCDRKLVNFDDIGYALNVLM